MKMPCPKCKNTRLFTYDRIVCPNCDSIKILDIGSQVRQRKTSLQKIEEAFEKKLLGMNLNKAFITALERRESTAEKIIKDPWTHSKEISAWVALSYLLCSCLPSEESWAKGKRTCGDFKSLLNMSVEIIKLKNEIDKLEKSQARVAQIGGKPEFCLTEYFPLSFSPKAVEQGIKEIVGADSEAFCQWQDGKKRENVETILTQALAMYPAIEIIKSEIINRQLKFHYNPRLFPSLNSQTVRKFVKISRELLRDLLYLRFEKIGKNGIIRMERKHIYSLSCLRDSFSQADVDWYLNLMSEYLPYDSGEDVYWLPYFTIKLLQSAVLKWSGLPQIGKGLDYVGKTVEGIIFNLLQSFEGNTTNPNTEEPLLRFIDPGTREEIADVMIYNKEHIILIESKFWDCPLLATLEDEIDKFEERVDLFKKKQTELGFPEAEVIPIFYTPFAPHVTWHGIQLIPSRFLLSMYLLKFFPYKEPKLVKKNDRLRRLVLSENYPIPYPIDAHELDHRINPNTCRIQDGLLVGCHKNEVDVEVLNPLGHSFVVTFDMTKETFQELKKQKIVPGTMIGMGIVNLSGSWSISQMLYARKINRNDPKRKIREIWGNTDVADEIIRVFQKHNLDIFKFIKFCKIRAPIKEYWPSFLEVRMGTVLFIDESFDFVGQCPCGQIMGFPKEHLELRKKMGFGRVLCRSCLEALKAGRTLL